MRSLSKMIPGDALKRDKPPDAAEWKKIVAKNKALGEAIPGGPTDLGAATVDALKRHTSEKE